MTEKENDAARRDMRRILARLEPAEFYKDLKAMSGLSEEEIGELHALVESKPERKKELIFGACESCAQETVRDYLAYRRSMLPAKRLPEVLAMRAQFPTLQVQPVVERVKDAQGNELRLDGGRVYFEEISVVRCAHCDISSIELRLMKCSRCRSAHYCNAQCQLAHWPQHRADCKKASQ